MEVVLALGVVAFGIIGVVGLLPVSLDVQRASNQRQIATEFLQQVSVSVQSQLFDAANGTYSFSRFLNDANLPISWKAGGTTKEYNLDLMEDGTVRSATTPASMRTLQKLHLQVLPPAAVAATALPKTAVTVKVSVAWPASSQWDTQGWQKSSGSLNAVLYALPY